LQEDGLRFRLHASRFTLQRSTPSLRNGGFFLIALFRGLAHNIAHVGQDCSAAANGIEAYPVEMEVNAGFGDTIIVIVGLCPMRR
jgi:hypothetical protein